MYDTIIVGAGIAGLAAAYRLIDRHILVLESEGIPGGRTESRQLGDYMYNVGAQVIMGNTCPIARLADELGVNRKLIAKSKVPIYFNKRLYSAKTQPGLLFKLPISVADKIRFATIALKVRRRFGGLLGQEFNPSDQRVKQLDACTAEMFLGSLSVDLQNLWNTISTIADGETIDVTTPYHPIMIMLHFLEEEYAVEGGTHQLTLELARRLDDRITLNANVNSVTQSQDHVEVTVAGPQGPIVHKAKHCILATPGPVVRAIVRDLPAWKADVLDKIEYASQTSAAVLLSKPSRHYLPEGVWRVPISAHSACAVTDPTFHYPQAHRQDSGQGMLRIYTGDLESRRLQSLSREQAIAEVTADLDDLFPGVQEDVIDADIRHWPLANAKWRPGHTALYPSLQAPTDRLHYCGDYTSAGYMNGSLTSAYRVVDEINNVL